MKNHPNKTTQEIWEDVQQVTLVAQQLALLYVGLLVDAGYRNTNENKKQKNGK